MENIQYYFWKVLAFAMVIVMLLGVKPNHAEKHDVLDEENLKFKFTVLSDCHLEGNNLYTFNTFNTMLRDIKNCTVADDATVFLGDNTMNGQHIESMFFYGSICLAGLKGPFVNAVGNHDIGNNEGDYNKLFAKFKGYNDVFLGNKVDAPSYCKVIDGVYFICIGSEELCCHEFYISDETVEWFEDTMEEAGKSGNPIFVCCHHPYNYVENQDEYVLYDIMKQYDNVFFLSGHTHMPLTSWWTFDDSETAEGFTFVNLPKATEVDSDGDPEYSGVGMQVEIYEDEVVFRARDYFHGVWIENFEKSFDLI